MCRWSNCPNVCFIYCYLFAFYNIFINFMRAQCRKMQDFQPTLNGSLTSAIGAFSALEHLYGFDTCYKCNFMEFTQSYWRQRCSRHCAYSIVVADHVREPVSSFWFINLYQKTFNSFDNRFLARNPSLHGSIFDLLLPLTNLKTTCVIFFFVHWIFLFILFSALANTGFSGTIPSAIANLPLHNMCVLELLFISYTSQCMAFE